MRWTAEQHGIVERGEAETTLDIPVEVDGMGEHIIIADYLENWKYRASTVRRPIFLGYHTYIHCPPIYIFKSQLANLVLEANLFCQDKPVGYDCFGKFKINKTTVSDEITIVEGHVEYPYDGTALRGLPLYLFKTAGRVTQNINPGTSNEAEIYIGDISTEYTALEVSVPTIMTNDRDDFTLVARVYKLLHSTVIDQSDIPKGGTMTFYLGVPDEDTAVMDNKLIYMGVASVGDSGYAHIDHCSADLIKGVYTIVAVYDPPEWSSKYVQTTGAGTLYYSETLVRPNITTDQVFIYNEGDSVSATFQSDEVIAGEMELYIDEQLVASKTLRNASEFTFDFDIPLKPETEALWAYPGIHYMVLRFTSTKGYINEYIFDFIIRYDTLPELEHPYGFKEDLPDISFQSYNMTWHVLNLNQTEDAHKVYVPTGLLRVWLNRSRPVITLEDGDVLIFNNNEQATFTFTTDISISGKVKILIDGVSVTTFFVEDVKTVTPSWMMPDKIYSYSMPGLHTLTVSYTPDEDEEKEYTWNYDCWIRYDTMPALWRVYNDDGSEKSNTYNGRTLYCAMNPLGVDVENLDDAEVLPEGLLYLYLNRKATAFPPEYTPEQELRINNDESSNLTFTSDQLLNGTITVYLDGVEEEEITVSNSYTFTTTFIAPTTGDTSSRYYPGEHTLRLVYTDSDGNSFTAEFTVTIRYNTTIISYNYGNSVDTISVDCTTMDEWSYQSHGGGDCVEPYADSKGVHSGYRYELWCNQTFYVGNETEIDMYLDLSDFYMGYMGVSHDKVCSSSYSLYGRGSYGLTLFEDGDSVKSNNLPDPANCRLNLVIEESGLMTGRFYSDNQLILTNTITLPYTDGFNVGMHMDGTSHDVVITGLEYTVSSDTSTTGLQKYNGEIEKYATQEVTEVVDLTTTEGWHMVNESNDPQVVSEGILGGVNSTSFYQGFKIERGKDYTVTIKGQWDDYSSAPFYNAWFFDMPSSKVEDSGRWSGSGNGLWIYVQDIKLFSETIGDAEELLPDHKFTLIVEIVNGMECTGYLYDNKEKLIATVTHSFNNPYGLYISVFSGCDKCRAVLTYLSFTYEEEVEEPEPEPEPDPEPDDDDSSDDVPSVSSLSYDVYCNELLRPVAKGMLKITMRRIEGKTTTTDSKQQVILTMNSVNAEIGDTVTLEADAKTIKGEGVDEGKIQFTKK